jgi:SAM-dependent methyltransferase
MTGSVPVPAMLDLIVELARGGRVLELGVGTGYMAIPLAARGVRIEGLDGSPQMLARLAEKPGGDQVVAHFGDFADVNVDGLFDVIFFASSSLFCLPDQESQVRCFRSSAAHLAPDGVFVVATYINSDRWFRDHRLHFIQAEGDGWRMHWNAINHPELQVTDVERVLESADGERRFPHRERYCSPAEMDLMAQVAGLRLRDRWLDWAKHPFNGEGDSISVYEHAHVL